MVLELLVRLPRAWNLCMVYAHVSVCVLMCMCVKWPPLSLAILCVNKGLSLSESWAHQLASLTGHPSVVIHCLCVLTTVVCALPCLSFYLRTSNPNSGAQTCTVSTFLQSVFSALQKPWRNSGAAGQCGGRPSALEHCCWVLFGFYHIPAPNTDERLQ